MQKRTPGTSALDSPVGVGWTGLSFGTPAQIALTWLLAGSKQPSW